jgi:ABC-type glycerol-3-phosphate transport system substrate-binding protein
MQETRKRFGISRKALATGIAAALLISGASALSATASSKKPAKKPAKAKPAAAKEIYDFYNPKCPKNATTLKIATPIILEVGGQAEQKIADDFMKACPNVKVEFIAIPSNDLPQKLTTMAIGGNMPDMYVHFTSFTGKALQMRVFEDLIPLLGKDYISGWDPMFFEESVINGKMLFAPWVGIPTGILYRKDLWAAAGNPAFPKTWDEFLAVAKKLTVDTDKDGKIDQYGWAIVGTPNGSGQGRFSQVVRNSGGYNYRETAAGKWESGAMTKGYLDALTLYQDAVKEGVVPPGYTTTGYPEASAQVANGKGVMMVTGPHSLGIVMKTNPSLAGKLAGFPMPTNNGAKPVTTLGNLGYAVSKSGKNKPLAIEYIKFQLSTKYQLLYNEVEWRLPSRLKAQKDKQVTGGMAEGFVAALKGGLWTEPTASFNGSIVKIDYEAYSEAFQGKKTPEQIQKEADAKIKKVIADNS